MKFLNKERRKERLDELDLPPAPPPLEGFAEDLSMPDIPDFMAKKDESAKLPEFDFPKEDLQEQGNDMDMKGFADFPEIKEEVPVSIPKISMPQMSMPQIEQMPEIEEPPEAQIEEHPETPIRQPMSKERPTFAHEKKATRVHMGTSLYVRVDKFKIALGSINVIRNDLRKTDEALIKLENIKGTEEKSMSRIKSSLDDIQKKLVFVDKTLFEGE